MVFTLFRGGLAFLAGFLAAAFFIIGVEGICAVLYPFPAGADSHSMEACQAHVAALPASAFIIAVIGWNLATLAGPWIATLLSRNQRPWPGILLGISLIGMAVFNMAMLPYPIWFWISNLLGLPATCYLGCKRGMISAGLSATDPK